MEDEEVAMPAWHAHVSCMPHPNVQMPNTINSGVGGQRSCEDYSSTACLRAMRTFDWTVADHCIEDSFCQFSTSLS